METDLYQWLYHEEGFAQLAFAALIFAITLVLFQGLRKKIPSPPKPLKTKKKSFWGRLMRREIKPSRKKQRQKKVKELVGRKIANTLDKLMFRGQITTDEYRLWYKRIGRNLLITDMIPKPRTTKASTAEQLQELKNEIAARILAHREAGPSNIPGDKPPGVVKNTWDAVKNKVLQFKFKKSA